MNNLEYVKKRVYGSSMNFSECARNIFKERCTICPYPPSNDIVGWLAEEYHDAALDYPVGTLVQWDEGHFDCSNESERRKNVYGIVMKQLCRERSLNMIEIKTTDRYGRPFTKTLWIPGSVVKHADIPSELVTILRDRFDLDTNKV